MATKRPADVALPESIYEASSSKTARSDLGENKRAKAGTENSETGLESDSKELKRHYDQSQAKVRDTHSLHIKLAKDYEELTDDNNIKAARIHSLSKDNDTLRDRIRELEGVNEKSFGEIRRLTDDNKAKSDEIAELTRVKGNLSRENRHTTSQLTGAIKILTTPNTQSTAATSQLTAPMQSGSESVSGAPAQLTDSPSRSQSPELHSPARHCVAQHGSQTAASPDVIHSPLSENMEVFEDMESDHESQTEATQRPGLDLEFSLDYDDVKHNLVDLSSELQQALKDKWKSDFCPPLPPNPSFPEIRRAAMYDELWVKDVVSKMRRDNTCIGTRLWQPGKSYDPDREDWLPQACKRCRRAHRLCAWIGLAEDNATITAVRMYPHRDKQGNMLGAWNERIAWTGD